MDAVINDPKIETTINTIANATELVAHVIRNIMGNDIASSLNGETITSDTIRTLARNRIQANLDKKDGVK